MADLKTLSKGSFDAAGNTAENVQLSCLMRIADATEAMATNHISLMRDYEWMKQSRDSHKAKNQKLENQIRTLKGVVTKLKNRAAKPVANG